MIYCSTNHGLQLRVKGRGDGGVEGGGWLVVTAGTARMTILRSEAKRREREKTIKDRNVEQV